MKYMSQIPTVHIVTGDQCMYGLMTPAEGGGFAPARKSTTFMTSSRQMADLLSKTCDKSHIHQHLVSGRCRDAAFYQLKLVQTILRGMRATRDVEKSLVDTGIEHRAMINAVMASAGAIPTESQEDQRLHPWKEIRAALFQ